MNTRKKKTTPSQAAALLKEMDTAKKETTKYYTLQKILQCGADYNIIIGERSNGKTYAALLYALNEYITNGGEFVYLRRWREDITARRAGLLFQAHAVNGEIEKVTNGKYNEVYFFGGRFFLSTYHADTGKRTPSLTPIGYALSLSEQEHTKSTQYPKVKTVVFDEFLTRRYYLPDEFILFMNTLSTIIRQRTDIKIFLLGNTVNKYSPYFAEFGLKHIKDQQAGTIDIYQYGTDGVKIAVEYTAPTPSKLKASNKYFCFDNEALKMITAGGWEVYAYPHLKTGKYKNDDIIFYFIVVCDADTLLQGDIIQDNNGLYCYIHRRTSPPPGGDNYILYTLTPTGKANERRAILSRLTPIDTRITALFGEGRVFYQDNETGELLRNYIQQSRTNNILIQK